MKDFMSDIFDDLASDIYRCLISQKTHDPDNDMAVNVADALIQLNETIENSTSRIEQALYSISKSIQGKK